MDNSDSRYKFTEKERDTETNWDYFGARYCNCRIGRSLSLDRFADADPSKSPYSYAGNNPVSFYDAHGDSVTWADDKIKDDVMNFYNAVDENGNPLHKEFVEQFNELQKSKQIYNVSYATLGNNKGDETTTFDGKQVEIQIDLSEPLSFAVALSHEFAHGQQFDRGELGFYQGKDNNLNNTRSFPSELNQVENRYPVLYRLYAK